MCGRFSQTRSWQELMEAYEILSATNERPNLPPRYNAAPTQRLPVVIHHQDKRQLVRMRWGLIPSWAKDASFGAKTINARGETVAEKPSFRSAFKSRRCLVPADSYFEWAGKGKDKQAWRVAPKQGYFTFAGLWERWNDPNKKGQSDAQPVYSFTIVTTAAAPEIAHLHHRAPVILPEADFQTWLTANDPAECLSLIRPCQAAQLTLYPVDNRVGKVANDDAELIAPLPQQSSMF